MPTMPAATTGEPLAELRAFLTPALRQHLEERGNRRLLSVFELLRRLRPGDLQTAMLCHRVVLIEAREDIRKMGFIDLPWADLPRLVFNVLDAQGHNWRSGRWELDPVRWHAQREKVPQLVS
jgi:hypothetical protein